MVDLARPAFGTTLAILLMWTYFAAVNFPFDAVEVVEVKAGSSAAKAGLRAGDVIVASASFDIAGAQRFVAAIQASGQNPLRFEVRRGSETTTAVVVPRIRQGRYSIGIGYWMRPGTPRPLGPVGAVTPALAFVAEAIRTFLVIPAGLWTGKSTQTTLFTEVYVAYVPSGYLGLVAWVLAALASVLVAMINLVPWPTTKLDGSRIFLGLFGAVTGRPIDQLIRSNRAKLTVFAVMVGLVVLYQVGSK